MTEVPKIFLDYVLSEIMELGQSELLRSRITKRGFLPLDQTDLTLNDLWSPKPDGKASDEFQAERKRIRKLVNAVYSKNPEMLSESLIVRELLSGVITPLLWEDISTNDARERAAQSVRNLVQYKAHRMVDVPIVHLKLRTQRQVDFGLLKFHRLVEADKADGWWTYISSAAQERIFAYAQTEAPGDLETSVRYTNDLVEASLLLLRGIGFPVQNNIVSQIGLVSEYVSSVMKPYRCHLPRQTSRMDSTSSKMALIEPDYNLLYVEDLMDKGDSAHLPTLLQIFNTRFKKGIKPLNDMQRKILEAFDWVGQATKPDSNSAKLLKLSVALELLVGGEASNSPYLTTRGISASIAERAALLLGQNTEERIEIDKNVKELYGLRSGIVHGNATEISARDLEAFVDLVRKLAWALIARLKELQSLEDLATWTVRERYTREVNLD